MMAFFKKTIIFFLNAVTFLKNAVVFKKNVGTFKSKFTDSLWKREIEFEELPSPNTAAIHQIKQQWQEWMWFQKAIRRYKKKKPSLKDSFFLYNN